MLVYLLEVFLLSIYKKISRLFVKSEKHVSTAIRFHLIFKEPFLKFFIKYLQENFEVV